MDKVIGFSLARGAWLPDPPWLGKYPWLAVERIERDGWRLTLWGHGDLHRFVGDSIVVGYSGVELDTLPTEPLQNRGLVVKLGPEEATIANDALGMLPLFYAEKDGMPLVSTCEECLLVALGGATLTPGRLVSYLIYQAGVGTLTLWREISKLYANRTLHVTADGRFEQQEQEPLAFDGPPDDAVWAMFEASMQVVRRYTDPLGEVYLPLSSGMDSRLILACMKRPERVRARSYPSSWPAEESWEVMIPRETARVLGVTDFGVLDFERDYSRWTRDAVDYYGTPVSAQQVYLYGASEMVYRDGRGLPALSGVIGDVLAGIGVRFAEEQLERLHHPYDLYRMGCYCHDKEWQRSHFADCLTLDWVAALAEVEAEGMNLWQRTEGNAVQKATLLRLRNRCAQIITYPWAALDIWGGIVPVFCDRDYVRLMLSLPSTALRNRAGQKALFERYFPDIWPYPCGLKPSMWCEANTMNSETIRNGGLRSIWPLAADGSKPALEWFKPNGVRALVETALEGNEAAWFRLHPLQSIAWAMDKGYGLG
jgi:hypothetical protein